MVGDADDDTFDPAKKKKKKKPVPTTASQMEAVRKEAHTLEEHHEHLFSASFDLSLNNAGHADVSSSLVGADFDNFFVFSDGLDLGDGPGDGLGLGDDLARELGWAASPAKTVHSVRYCMNLFHLMKFP